MYGQNTRARCRAAHSGDFVKLGNHRREVDRLRVEHIPVLYRRFDATRCFCGGALPRRPRGLSGRAPFVARSPFGRDVPDLLRNPNLLLRLRRSCGLSRGLSFCDSRLAGSQRGLLGGTLLLVGGFGLRRGDGRGRSKRRSSALVASAAARAARCSSATRASWAASAAVPRHADGWRLWPPPRPLPLPQRRGVPPPSSLRRSLSRSAAPRRLGLGGPHARPVPRPADGWRLWPPPRRLPRPQQATFLSLRCFGGRSRRALFFCDSRLIGSQRGLLRGTLLAGGFGLRRGDRRFRSGTALLGGLLHP